MTRPAVTTLTAASGLVQNRRQLLSLSLGLTAYRYSLTQYSTLERIDIKASGKGFIPCHEQSVQTGGT